MPLSSFGDMCYANGKLVMPLNSYQYQILDPATGFTQVGTLGAGQGSGNGQVQRLGGIAWNGTDYYILDSSLRSVSRFDSAGSWISTFGSGSITAEVVGIAANSYNIFVKEIGRVLVFTPGGLFIDEWSIPNTPNTPSLPQQQTTGIAADNARVYVVFVKNETIIDPSGQSRQGIVRKVGVYDTFGVLLYTISFGEALEMRKELGDVMVSGTLLWVFEGSYAIAYDAATGEPKDQVKVTNVSNTTTWYDSVAICPGPAGPLVLTAMSERHVAHNVPWSYVMRWLELRTLVTCNQVVASANLAPSVIKNAVYEAKLTFQTMAGGMSVSWDLSPVLRKLFFKSIGVARAGDPVKFYDNTLNIRLRVYNQAGALASVVNQSVSMTDPSLRLDTSEFSSGVYLGLLEIVLPDETVKADPIRFIVVH